MATFWAQGYEATSLQDLLTAMRLSKSSLYQRFGDKARLFDHCLRHYCDTQANTMLEQLRAAGSGRAFIERSFYALADDPECNQARWGCLLMNTASEFGRRDSQVASGIDHGVAAFTRVFQTAVRQAQHEGEINADKNADNLARYLVSNMSGLKTLIKAGTGRDDARAIVAIVLQALD